MKKPLMLLGALALVGAGCTQSTPASTTPSTVPSTGTSVNQLQEADRVVDQRTGDTSKAAEASANLGMNLPPNTSVLSSLNSANATAVSARTSLSLQETVVFLTAEVAKAGYQPSRLWGVSPADTTTAQSASFRGPKGTMSINARSEGSMTTFEIQVQR